MESEHATEKSQLNEQLSLLTKSNNEMNINLEKTKEKLTQVNIYIYLLFVNGLINLPFRRQKLVQTKVKVTFSQCAPRLLNSLFLVAFQFKVLVILLSDGGFFIKTFSIRHLKIYCNFIVCDFHI